MKIPHFCGLLCAYRNSFNFHAVQEENVFKDMSFADEQFTSYAPWLFGAELKSVFRKHANQTYESWKS